MAAALTKPSRGSAQLISELKFRVGGGAEEVLSLSDQVWTSLLTWIIVAAANSLSEIIQDI